MKTFCLHVLLLAVFAIGAFGQTTTGRMEGNISDPQGAAVPGAQIAVTNALTGLGLSTISDERGNFVIPSLPAAEYKVTITHAGFKTASLEHVKIEVGTPATLNVKLDLGALAETVEVSGGAEILQTATATVSSTLVGKQLHELPFTSRNLTELLVTQAGTAVPGIPRDMSINALPEGWVSVTVEGISSRDNLNSPWDPYTPVFARADAVEEMTVTTTAQGADSTGDSAAQVRFVTRRGTNDWHGGLFWQHRNTALNANYYFNNRNRLPRDQMILNQGGVHLGGPFVRNRAFFFVNWEGFWLPQSYNVSARILTPEAPQGIFRYRDGTQIRSVNLFDLARDKNPTLPANVRQFPTTSDPTIQAIVNEYLRLATSQTGSLRERIETNSDYNRNDFTFQAPGTN